MFLGFGVNVSEDVDIRVVDPEPAEQRGHPEDTEWKIKRLHFYSSEVV